MAAVVHLTSPHLTSCLAPTQGRGAIPTPCIRPLPPPALTLNHQHASATHCWRAHADPPPVARADLLPPPGYERVESALALMNLTTVARFTDKHTIGGADLGMFSTAGAICGVPAGEGG